MQKCKRHRMSQLHSHFVLCAIQEDAGSFKIAFTGANNISFSQWGGLCILWCCHVLTRVMQLLKASGKAPGSIEYAWQVSKFSCTISNVV